MELLNLLENPIEFFENIKDKDWKHAFKFFLIITIILSSVTPIINYFGIESTDLSSAYQAQILAYRILYQVKESKAIIFLAIMLALIFIEIFTKGTTIRF